MIRGFKTISHEAALTLSGLPPIISRLHERVLSYAAEHPDHYTLGRIYRGLILKILFNLRTRMELMLRIIGKVLWDRWLLPSFNKSAYCINGASKQLPSF